MSNHELSIILPELEIPDPVAAKPAIPKEAPIRRDEPLIPNPIVPKYPTQEPRIPVFPQTPRIPSLPAPVK